MAIKSVARRVTDLEEREAILYGFLDDLRFYTKKIDQRLDQHEEQMRESSERIKQNEDGLNETRAMTRAINVLHADSLKRIAQNEEEFIETRKLLQLMHERVSRLEDRQNGSKK